MQDGPEPSKILAAVAVFLRASILPKLEGSDAFQLRVAANAIDLVSRELALAPLADAVEREKLATLLGSGTRAESLSAEFARRITTEELDWASPEVEAMLWTMTETKLAVDQPAYPGLIHARALRARAARQETPE